ncbi:regulatory protein RecX [Paenibacillus cymbidii]|uniref:regulatory protein RecX n=1 Tax=Paenibacillus cymbidii TaxID=1639034 RepID=UPI001080933E|nr:RecX family transcriptional regulator [Paenibacillus cymbidii]
MDETNRSIITQVEKQKTKAHRYHIFVDGRFAFSVHEDVMVKFRLMKGAEIDADSAAAAVAEDERLRCYHEAARYVGRQPRAAQEVQQHLLGKGYEEEGAAEAVRRLKEQGYIDDRQFAQQWTEFRVRSQKKGKRWVQQELREKGVDKEHIAEALAGMDEETEYTGAYELARKKWASSANAELPARKRKLAAFLLRRGYTLSIVNRVLAALQAGSVEEMESLDDF